jgi:hypothetical protein
LIASEAFLHASETAQGTIESALSHCDYAGIIAGCELASAFLLEADLLAQAEADKKQGKEDFCY